MRPEVFAWGDQTSAHAEMDPQTSFSSGVAISNLRSRGDGPRACFCPTTRSAKPPLTRRWTQGGRGDRPHGGQTSAHAEMDPLSSCSTAQITANLRSRGDGPTALFLRGGRVFKPPLTRRWTRYLSHGISKMPQTSAHAEMDLAPATQTKIFKPNLRSRGDGPKPRLRGHFLFCKPPLTRRWTRQRRLFPERRLQTSAHAEMDLPCLPSGPCGPANLRSRGDEPQMHDADGR